MPKTPARTPSTTRRATGKTTATPKRVSRSRKNAPVRLPRAELPGWAALSPERKLDILGVALALLGVLTLFSLLSSEHSAITGWWVDIIRQVAGRGAVVLPLAFILFGVWLVLRNVERLPMLSAERSTGAVLLYLNLLAWLHLLEGGGWVRAAQGSGGGYVGAVFEVLFTSALGTAGAVVVLVAWSLIAFALLLDVSISEIFTFVQNILASLARRSKGAIVARRAAQSAAPLPNLGQQQPLGASSAHATYSAPAPLTPTSLPGGFQPLRAGNAPLIAQRTTAPQPAAPEPVPTTASARHRQQWEKRIAAEKAAETGNASPNDISATQPVIVTPPAPPWKLPNPADILAAGTPAVLKQNLDVERSKLIEDTLNSFGTPVRVVDVQRGPTVTQFGIEPLYIENRQGRTRVRVSRIVALADDLALALAASRIRIQAPVPGRSYVGIEVPNAETSRVVMRDVMESEAFTKLTSPLRFALGKDVSGHPKAYDLGAMPHLLIAGTTGAGKSVLVNALLSCLLLNNTPATLRMILVDPKRVELTGYNGIPHLLTPVVVEAEQVVGALQWAQREMDARYHRFSQVGARNIADYNAKNTPPLPYLVVLIDELADLMMLAPEETERSLARLAQLARATGIHLVLATQRPSVNVVTGLIKANFPARIAFMVASGIDSRVILDQVGAERLLGRGDMLFQAPDAAAPVRIQGVFVADAEIQRLVEFWRNQAYELRNQNTTSATAVPVNMDIPTGTPLRQTPLWDEETGTLTNPNGTTAASPNGSSGSDPMLEEVIKLVRQEGHASITMLQRKLRIGYTRSARLIEALEEKGIIGPPMGGSQVREVLPPSETPHP